MTPDSQGFASVAEYLTDSVARSEILRPGVELWAGPLWWAALALMVLGLGLSLAWAEGPLIRGLSLVGIAAGVGYLVGPQLLVLFGRPWFFVSNLRYGVVALGMGLMLLPLITVLRTGRRIWIAPCTYAVVMAVTLTDEQLWSGVADVRFVDPIATSDAVVGAITAGVVALAGGLGVWWHHHRPEWRPTVPVIVAGAVAVIGLGAIVISAYDERYESMPGYALARDLSDERIAIEGLNVQYPLYGLDLSNRVEPIGRIEEGRFEPIRDCVEWRREVNDGGYTYLFIGTADPDDGAGPVSWTASDEAVEEIYRGRDDFNPFIDLVDRDRPYPFIRRAYHINGPLDPSSCPT